MKILLVRPPRIKQAITIGEFMFCEPIGLEAVYAVLKDRHELRILDMMVENVSIRDVCRSWTPDVVGLTSLCVDVVNVLKIAREVKESFPGIVTVVGGTQTYLGPDAFQEECIDHIFKYTTRANLLEFFAALESGGEVPVIDGVLSRSKGYKSSGREGRNEYIVPDLECTKQYRQHYSYFGFKPCAIIQTSQGCSKTCRFCLRWRIEGATEADQDMECIFDQIRRIQEPSIMVFDNDFLTNAARLHALCDFLEREGIRKNFMCYGSVNSVLRNSDAVKRFAKNGLAAVLIGYESFKQADLEGYKKKSTVNDNLEAARLLKAWGVDAWASFIMSPDWDVSDFRQFRKYIRLLSPEISSCTPMTPFPGLPYHEEFKDRLIYRKEDYEMWSFGMVSVMPSRMSVRRYYWEVLKTNFYINLFMNNLWYLVRKFGWSAMYRILAGSLRITRKYIGLMRSAPAARAM